MAALNILGRMRLYKVLLISCLLCAKGVVAQHSVLEGRVFDRETKEPVIFAHVFISGTTHVTVTDDNGLFRLRDIPESGELVVSYVGYQNFSMRFTSARKPGKIEIALLPSPESLAVVTVAATEDKEWQKNLKLFKRDFLGRTTNAKGCEILNPWVLEFEKKGATFLADASAPIDITNSTHG
jgi:hypothetical protein